MFLLIYFYVSVVRSRWCMNSKVTPPYPNVVTLPTPKSTTTITTNIQSWMRRDKKFRIMLLSSSYMYVMLKFTT